MFKREIWKTACQENQRVHSLRPLKGWIAQLVEQRIENSETTHFQVVASVFRALQNGFHEALPRLDIFSSCCTDWRPFAPKSWPTVESDRRTFWSRSSIWLRAASPNHCVIESAGMGVRRRFKRGSSRTWSTAKIMGASPRFSTPSIGEGIEDR